MKYLKKIKNWFNRKLIEGRMHDLDVMYSLDYIPYPKYIVERNKLVRKYNKTFES